jgi:hypothetical protein
MAEFLIVLAILSLVVVFVTVPLRRPSGGEANEVTAAATELGELEAARESKYREIRDAELDHRTGKLSDEDYEAIDSGLRAEAVEILRALDRVRAPGERLPS